MEIIVPGDTKAVLLDRQQVWNRFDQAIAMAKRLEELGNGINHDGSSEPIPLLAGPNTALDEELRETVDELADEQNGIGETTKRVTELESRARSMITGLVIVGIVICSL
jgi:hypothetical protein